MEPRAHRWADWRSELSMPTAHHPPASPPAYQAPSLCHAELKALLACNALLLSSQTSPPSGGSFDLRILRRTPLWAPRPPVLPPRHVPYPLQAHRLISPLTRSLSRAESPLSSVVAGPNPRPGLAKVWVTERRSGAPFVCSSGPAAMETAATWRLCLESRPLLCADGLAGWLEPVLWGEIL